MGSFNLQQWLTWIIISATAVCVSCQEQGITSTLREGNSTCPGEVVIFTCTLRGSLGLGWISPGYINNDNPLQFSTASMLDVDVPSMIDGRTTATARLTTNTMENGVRVLESTLRITATVDSTVTCSGTIGDSASIDFSISAVPGIPQRISAAEISRPRDNICIILVIWSPPANSDTSDIDQYIVYIPSRNIRGFSSSTVSTLTVMNCGDDTRVQVAAVNRIDCVGMNSSEVQLTLLDIPTAPTEDGGSITADGGSSSTDQLGAGAVAGITIAVISIILIVVPIIIIIIILSVTIARLRASQKPDFLLENRTQETSDSFNTSAIEALRAELEKVKAVREPQESCLIIKESLLSLYFALRSHPARSSVIGAQEETSDRFITGAMGALRAELKKAKAIDARAGLMNSLEQLKREEDKDVRRALDYLMEIFPDMSSIDDGFKINVEELRDEKKSPSIKDALEVIEDIVDYTAPDKIQKVLLRFCDALFQKFLKLSPKQKEVVNMFEVSSESLKEVERLLSAEFIKGLEREGEDVKVKMLVTHIHEMPKGTEEGEFLVVDLGAHHVQVLHIIVIKGSIKNKDSTQFYISEDIKNSSYKNLFDFVVDSIAKFIKDRKIRRQLPIAFTFPFPMKHESLTCGRLIRWTKDFKLIGGEGMDVAQLLKEAASRREDNMEVNVVALINDTTGMLLSVGNEVPDCQIGLVLGDGTNACYMEEIRDVPKFSGDRSHSKVIVNTEWGAFGDDGKLDRWRNEYDRKLDKKSSNEGQQLFEKMISDKYQGVIVCLVLKDLISKEELFGGKSSDRFDGVESFIKERLSTMEGWDMKKCRKLLKNRFGIEASNKDCEVIRRVCVAVSTRAARLTAAGIVALVKKIKKTRGCTVAVAGSLYKRNQFPDKLSDALDELEPRSNIKMKLTEDGSSIGAAFAAAMNYVGSLPSSAPRSPTPEESVGLEERQELTYVNIGDQGRHPPQAGDIELSEIIVVENQ